MKLAFIVSHLWLGMLGVCFAQSPTWTQKFPNMSPPGRWEHALAYDQPHSQIVLFGGIGSGSGASSELNDTWTWDGDNWTQKFPSSAPSPRYLPAMAYDGLRGQVVLFGGVSFYSPFNGSTWVWDGTNWIRKTPMHSPGPDNSTVGVMAYDAASGQVVFFRTGLGNGQTWIWNGTDWTQKFPATSPSPRNSTQISFDSAHNQVVLFGGQTASGDVNDTWVWDGTNWIQKFPSVSPPKRSDFVMAYDNAQGRILIFGGTNTSGSASSMWSWDGTSWTQLFPTSYPPERTESAMAYDGARSEIVLFGGFGITNFGVRLNDSWVWSSAQTTVPVILVHGFCSDPSSFRGMKRLLGNEGLVIGDPFDYSFETKIRRGAPDFSIEELASRFSAHIAKVLRDNNATQVDVVAHSMGGLIVRAWMSGLTSGRAIPYTGQIRRLIALGTPNYGIALPTLGDFLDFSRSLLPSGTQCSNAQEREQLFGSAFIWSLHDKWFEAPRISPSSFLFIAGTQGAPPMLPIRGYECNDNEGCNDGLVDISSAVLPDTPAEMIKYVPYRHADFSAWGTAEIIHSPTNDRHLTFRIVRDFLKNGDVSSQAAIGYMPPHLRGGQDRQEGLLLLRLLDPSALQPVTGATAPFVSFTPYQPRWSYGQFLNRSAGTITLWGLRSQTYSSLSVEVNPRGNVFIYSGAMVEVTVNVAHPVVPPPLVVHPPSP